MPSQHTKDDAEEKALEAEIGVPLDLPELRVVEQSGPCDGILKVTVIAKTSTAHCPHCQQKSPYVHDCRERTKRDLAVPTTCAMRSLKNSKVIGWGNA